MHSKDINAYLASRTASLLAEWAGLAPVAKAQIGDPMGTALLLMSKRVRSETPSLSAVQNMESHIFAALSSHDDGAYISYNVDYGLDYMLSSLADACGIRASWPNKSSMAVSKVYRDGSGSNSVSVSTGYRAPTVTHYLTDAGWLVSHVSIPRQLHALVLKGIAAGDVPADVATFELF
jgi:hypothetical protein